MLYCINVDNVNEALAQGLRWLSRRGEPKPSRVGDVLVSPCPVTTCYSQPTQRVLFSPMRDANPFFHLMESIWMLAGRNDIAFPAHFNKRFIEYSDDGLQQWGAYGWRWRSFFGYDQLRVIIEELKINPDSRRAVLSMWSPAFNEEGMLKGSDLHIAMGGGKDVPCNTNIFFRIRDGLLDMQVNNRSNDIVWGAYGANAVHMSILQEFMAHAIGVGVGRLYQSSWNYHAYTNFYPKDGFLGLADDAIAHNYYDPRFGGVKPTPLLAVDENWEVFLEECNSFVEGGVKFETDFLRHVCVPMREAWNLHKEKDYAEAESECLGIRAADWRRACSDWLGRRRAKWEAKGGHRDV